MRRLTTRNYENMTVTIDCQVARQRKFAYDNTASYIVVYKSLTITIDTPIMRVKIWRVQFSGKTANFGAIVNNKINGRATSGIFGDIFTKEHHRYEIALNWLYRVTNAVSKMSF